MTTVDPVETTAARLRDAITTGSHSEAAALSQQFCRMLEERMRGLGPQDPRLPQMAREALGLLEWARRTTLAQRAGYAARLSAIPDFRPYGAPARPAHAWNFQV